MSQVCNLSAEARLVFKSSNDNELQKVKNPAALYSAKTNLLRNQQNLTTKKYLLFLRFLDSSRFQLIVAESDRSR